MRWLPGLARQARAVLLVAALAAVAAPALPACLGNEGDEQFHVALEFGGERGGPRACTEACSAYPMRCPARFGVRIVDGKDPSIEYGFRCIDTPVNSTDLCDLGALDIQFGEMPRTVARAEIAVWREDLLFERRCLRTELFDLQGEPLVTIRPQPAFGGAAYFEIGGPEEVRVPIACIVPEQLAADMCPPEPSSR